MNTALLILLALQSPIGPSNQSLESSLRTWREVNGGSWRTELSHETPYCEMLYGGRVPAAFIPLTEGEWFELARVRLTEARALLGLDPAHLVPRELTFLPLGWIGTSDKLTISFDQILGGVLVEGARANVLFDAAGGLLSLHTTCAVGELSLGAFDLDADAALARSLEAFAVGTGLAGVTRDRPRRAYWPIPAGGVRPVWITEVSWESAGTLPVGRSIVLDAQSGAVLSSSSTVHTLDITGSVRSRVTPGTEPDNSSNPEVWQPVPHLKLSGSFGEVQTDANGDFVLPGVNGSVSVTAVYEGEFARTNDESGSDYSITTSVSNGGQISMNNGTGQYDTAEANAFVQIGALRDWVRAINPNDSHADFTATANCNINSSCNAYFNGSSVNFFRQSGSCANTAYSTVIAHEIGHWLNVRYGTGNGADGMGEGNADIFAMYLYDDPIVGEDFCGNGCHVRNGNNNAQFCGDWNSACYGGVHADGKPWMGAAWKVRTQLNNSSGDSEGDLIADSLFFGWMNAFNQGEIRSIIEAQWILLDDDDGDILNGSPHFSEIDAGFRQQGFPGLDLVPLTVELVQLFGDSEVEQGPYTAEFHLKQHFGEALTSAELVWRFNGGAWQTSALTAQIDDLYLGSIPDLPSPTVVQYYARVSDVAGNVATDPLDAPTGNHSFAIGRYILAHEANFDDLTSDEGWTHQSFGDTSNHADDWRRGWPEGAGGIELAGNGINGVYWADPSEPVSGYFSWGNDLGGATDGQYPNNAHSWLRSPAIDASGWLGVRLRFQRQLSVARLDEARLRVSGSGPFASAILYASGDATHTSDLEWTQVEYDISHIADGEAAVVLEWELLTDSSTRLGGWNIDSVELLRLIAYSSDDCIEPRVYGAGKIHSGGVAAELFPAGEPAVGADFEFRVQFAVPSQPSLLFSGVNAIEVPFAGGFRLTGGDLRRHGTRILSLAGAAAFQHEVSSSMAGSTRFFQLWFRDPPHPDGTGIGLSQGLRVDYCL